MQAINEINRILKPGGKALITVWAKEQKYKEKESYYISTKGSKKQSEKPNKRNSKTESDKIPEPDQVEVENENSNVHKFGKEFQKKDLFVAWHYNSNTQAKKKLEIQIVPQMTSLKLFNQSIQ